MRYGNAGRMGGRKSGYSIESIALGAILILFAVPLMINAFSLVRRQMNFYNYSEFMPLTTSEIRRTFQDYRNYDDVDNEIIISSGIVAEKMLDPSDAEGILLPYGGTVEFAPARGGSHFSATVTWPNSTTDTRAFCVKMSKSNAGVNSSGVLGLLYEIEDADCAAEHPSFVAVYHRI